MLRHRSGEPPYELRSLLLTAEQRRSEPLFAGRCLDIEALINCGADESVVNALRVRALNREATGRERCLAALGIVDLQGSSGQSVDVLHQIIRQLRADHSLSPEL